MKVLKDNYNAEKTIKSTKPIREVVCEHCGSVLEYEESDMRIGAFGCACMDCPCCGKDITLYEEDGLTLTTNNVEFPAHFWHTSKETGAVDCCNNKEVRRYINEGIDYLRENKDETNWFCCTGNLYIDVSKLEGDENYWVVVSNNYYDTYIPFEEEDY